MITIFQISFSIERIERYFSLFSSTVYRNLFLLQKFRNAYCSFSGCYYNATSVSPSLVPCSGSGGEWGRTPVFWPRWVLKPLLQREYQPWSHSPTHPCPCGPAERKWTTRPWTGSWEPPNCASAGPDHLLGVKLSATSAMFPDPQGPMETLLKVEAHPQTRDWPRPA